MATTFAPGDTSTGSSCDFPAFEGPLDQSKPAGATPIDAVHAFISHGSIDGLGQMSPGKAGYPTSGWKITQQSASSAMAVSGIGTLTVELRADGQWQVTKGTKAC
jgi:hypothetical protein